MKMRMEYLVPASRSKLTCEQPLLGKHELFHANLETLERVMRAESDQNAYPVKTPQQLIFMF